VERRKASALRSARGRARSAFGWQHPMRGEAPRDSCAFSALRLPLFFGGKSFVALVGKTRARVHRENGIARAIRPRDSGGGGPLELAKRANRGGGGAGLGASLSVRIDYSGGAASFTRKETSKLNVNARRQRLCSVESCAPSTTPSGWSPSPAIAVADGASLRRSLSEFLWCARPTAAPGGPRPSACRRARSGCGCRGWCRLWRRGFSGRAACRDG